MPDLIVVLILVLAAFVHGAFGFGFPLVATPLLVLGLEPRLAILVTLVPTICINLVSIAGEKHWREALSRFWPIPVFTLVGSMTGTRILLHVDPEPLRMLLALVLIAYLLADRFMDGGPERRVPKWGLALLGLIMGLMAGVVNIFAPIVVVFALYTRMDPLLMVAAFNLSFVTSKSGQLTAFFLNGAVDPGTLTLSLWALPPVILSLWIGIKLRKRIDPDAYKGLLRYALWAIALLLIFDWARE
jgi:uncharacterized membrane protein YfcA